jgi:hypothetical protein
MSTPATLSERPVIHVGPDVHGYPEARIVPPSPEAANDSSWLDDRDADFYRNPLWLIAAAGGCLFATLAVLLAFN